jgi:ATP synthase protein I
MVRASVFLGALSALPVLPGFMKQENRRAWRELAYFSSIGFSVALSIFIGLGVGVYLDRRFDTSPWCTLVFLVLGIAAAFRNIGLAIKKSRKL